MAFEVKLETGSISNEGAILKIIDVTNWAESPEGSRNKYGIFIKTEYRAAIVAGTDVVSTPEEPLTDVEWSLQMIGDGEYSTNGYVFLTVAATTVPVEGDVAVDVDNLLKRYNGVTWDEVNLEDHIGDAALYTGTFRFPYLNDAYIYKNQLNLEYIAQVKSDMAGGADQNKLYYKRVDLDYYAALIDGAGYNSALGLRQNFFDIVDNLNEIRDNQQIS